MKPRENAFLRPEMAPEAAFEELCKLLPQLSFDDLICLAPELACAIPELAPMIGFDQHSPHHAYDLYTHTAYVTAAVPGEPVLRWAALLHDIGKVPTFTQDKNGRGHFYGHAQAGAEMADTVLRRMKAPEALRQQVVTLIGLHMTRLEPDKQTLQHYIDQLGWDTVQNLLQLQQADMSSKGVGNRPELAQFSVVRRLLEEISSKEETL